MQKTVKHLNAEKSDEIHLTLLDIVELLIIGKLSGPGVVVYRLLKAKKGK